MANKQRWIAAFRSLSHGMSGDLPPYRMTFQLERDPERFIEVYMTEKEMMRLAELLQSFPEKIAEMTRNLGHER